MTVAAKPGRRRKPLVHARVEDGQVVITEVHCNSPDGRVADLLVKKSELRPTRAAPAPASTPARRRLRVAPKQHTRPCSDCPWRREAQPAWLGALSVEDWIQAAHGEAKIDCHIHKGPECAGAAIYRANVCKSLRDTSRLRLPPDRVAVFASPAEFRAYHGLDGDEP